MGVQLDYSKNEKKITILYKLNEALSKIIIFLKKFLNSFFVLYISY